MKKFDLVTRGDMQRRELLIRLDATRSFQNEKINGECFWLVGIM